MAPPEVVASDAANPQPDEHSRAVEAAPVAEPEEATDLGAAAAAVRWLAGVHGASGARVLLQRSAQGAAPAAYGQRFGPPAASFRSGRVSVSYPFLQLICLT